MLDLHILIEKEGELYSALCLELNIASQGKTIAEVERNIREAIELYLEDVYGAGEEKEFIPRPAPAEEWIKFFRREAEIVREMLLKDKKGYNLKEVVVG